ncbi:MAG: hypothetical protein U9O24_08560 [Campylobacterota bacterium]|nr:hypothetical protein [Campylobacterota bacterium]
MKKNLFLLLTFLLIFVFSGCGSNSKVDGIPDSSTDEIAAVEMVQNYIVKNSNNLDFTLALPFTKKLESKYLVTLDGYGFTVNGCTMSATPSYEPAVLTLDGGAESQETLYITGTFDTNCTVFGYTFTATQTVTKDGNLDKSDFSSTFSYDDPDGGDIAPPSSDGYTFFNATTPLEITKFNTAYPLKVQLINNEYIATGEEVELKAFNSNLGSVKEYKVTTTKEGYANFEYTSPTVLPTNGLISNALEIVFEYEENNQTVTISQFIDLNFNSSSGTGTVNYSFGSVSNAIITHADQTAVVAAQLNFNGVPIEGKTVTMLAITNNPNNIKGSIEAYTVTTGSDGFAKFNYTGPSSLSEVNGTTVTLTVQFDETSDNIEDNVHLEVNPSIYFEETTDAIIGDITLPTVVIPGDLRVVTLDSNSKTVQIALNVYEDITPYTQGSVRVELPEKVLNGVDVGLFDEYEVQVNSQGIALFNYTGPSNLKALIDNGDTESIFKFYHTQNSENRQPMRVDYERPQNPHVTRNYELSVVTSGDFSMGIPEKEKTFNVLLQARDTSGNEVSLTDETINKITVETTNSPIAQILDTTNGLLVDILEIPSENNSPFILKSKELSGLVPMEVTVEFTDVNGDPQTLTTIINVRVFSGPASAISISYVSTGQDPDRSKYVETLAISVTDEYGNRVNTRPNISLGAIVGYVVDGKETTGSETNETRRLFYGRSDIIDSNANGEIIALGANQANFEDNTPNRADVFKYVNAEGNNTDKLVVFGEQKNYEAMGKWDISKIDNHTLSLKDDYYGVDREGLYYAVGHNYYQDQCREDGREWVGSTDSDTYQLDEEGTVTVTYKYDYHLTGKDALIWVNLDGVQPDTGVVTKIGETVKHTLRGNGLVAVPNGGYSLAKGASGYGTFILWHENAPERYRNGHFGYGIKDGSTCYYEVVATSNPFDARTCDNRMGVDTDNYSGTPDVMYGTLDGTSYISFYLEAAPDKACTFNLTNFATSSEF